MAEITREQVIDFLSNMPVLEMTTMIHTLEESWGVSAAPVAVQPGGPQQVVEEEEAQTEFDVILESAGGAKMKVIKEVRALTHLGLKEAKELVESAPKTVKEALGKEEAAEMKTKLEAVGATVTLK